MSKGETIRTPGVCVVCGASADGEPCACGAALCDTWVCLMSHLRHAHGETIQPDRSELRRCGRCGTRIGVWEAWGNAGECDACAWGDEANTEYD